MTLSRDVGQLGVTLTCDKIMEKLLLKPLECELPKSHWTAALVDYNSVYSGSLPYQPFCKTTA